MESSGFSLDKATILDSFGDDEELFIAMASMFVQEADTYVLSLRSAFSAGDLGVLQREAHTLKSLLATFADSEGAARARAVEKSEAMSAVLPEQIDWLSDRLLQLKASLQGELPTA